jgi:hypothetical protein
VNFPGSVGSPSREVTSNLDWTLRTRLTLVMNLAFPMASHGYCVVNFSGQLRARKNFALSGGTASSGMAISSICFCRTLFCSYARKELRPYATLLFVCHSERKLNAIHQNVKEANGNRGKCHVGRMSFRFISPLHISVSVGRQSEEQVTFDEEF